MINRRAVQIILAGFILTANSFAMKGHVTTSHKQVCTIFSHRSLTDDITNEWFRSLKVLASSACLLTVFFHSPSMVLAEEQLTARQKIIRGTETFLTNPVLEAIRKIDQLDPDEKSVETNKAILLVPIVDIIKDIESVKELISLDKAKVVEGRRILSENKFDVPIFKKIFNRYSDNIFYVDPRRANLYLGGGATPNSLQTQQYLYRNAALTAIGNIKDDLKNLVDDISSGKSKDELNQSVDDAVDDCREALDALRHYIDLADKADVELARKVIYAPPI